MPLKYGKNDFFQDSTNCVGVAVDIDTGEKLPVFIVDHGNFVFKGGVRFLIDHEPFSLSIDRVGEGRYVYCVCGSQNVPLPDPKGILGAPRFSITHETNERRHGIFQENFKRTKVWLLLIRSDIDSFFVIDEQGKVQHYYESSRVDSLQTPVTFQ